MVKEYGFQIMQPLDPRIQSATLVSMPEASFGFQIMQPLDPRIQSATLVSMPEAKSSNFKAAQPDTIVHLSETVPRSIVTFFNTICPGIFNKLLIDSFNVLSIGIVDDILSEDVVANTSTMSLLLPVAKAFLYYNELKCEYESQQICKRNSLLCNTIAKISLFTSKVSQAFKNVELQLSKLLGLNQLAKQTLEKGALLTEATKLAIDLKKDVECKYLLNALRRRLSQRGMAQDTCGITIDNKNPSSLTREAAYCRLIKVEHAVTPFCLSCWKLDRFWKRVCLTVSLISFKCLTYR